MLQDLRTCVLIQFMTKEKMSMRMAVLHPNATLTVTVLPMRMMPVSIRQQDIQFLRMGAPMKVHLTKISMVMVLQAPTTSHSILKLV